MMEEWRDICGYEGLYQVSNLGRIRRVHKDPRSNPCRYLIPSCNNNSNYYRVRLSKNNQVTMHTVHRLVAAAFVPNPDNKPQVNHIDGNKHNNSADNLEWVTSQENRIHAYKTGLHNTLKRKKGIEALFVPIRQYSKDGVFLKQYASIKDAANACGCNRHISALICRCAKGNSKSAYGYVWRYAEGVES